MPTGFLCPTVAEVLAEEDAVAGKFTGEDIVA
jgi:hypothetical protein